jgi:diguanylate cyclase (GGDEF)-like protein
VKKITKKDLAYLFFFPVFPAAGGIIQFLFPGTSVIWVTVTISIFIIFINIQKEQMHTDYLTGVNNRKCLEEFLQTINKDLGKEPIAGIMIDIDDFKGINDKYGHDQGDQALKYTSQILKDTFRKTDFIARYGGDEFIVVMKREQLSELDVMIQRLNENVSRFNAQKSTPYEISLSIGYSFYKKESGTSTNEFLQEIDRLMYVDKQRTVKNSDRITSWKR